MDTFKEWNLRQKHLQTLLRKKADIHEIIAIASLQHQATHVAAMNSSNPEAMPTAEDELWNALDEEIFRHIPTKSIYSVAWHLWHSARIEDITVNFFITQMPQIHENYKKALGVPFIDTGNAMDLKHMQQFSAKINMSALYEYRVAVGRRTQEAIQRLTIDVLEKKYPRKVCG